MRLVELKVQCKKMKNFMYCISFLTAENDGVYESGTAAVNLP